jgi:class 3 adenylate cyclase
MGNVGAESRLSFRMVGQPMNTANRLVDLAEDGQIVISEVVYEALKEKAPILMQRIEFERMGPIMLKGILEPQVLYRTQIARTILR